MQLNCRSKEEHGQQKCADFSVGAFEKQNLSSVGGDQLERLTMPGSMIGVGGVTIGGGVTTAGGGVVVVGAVGAVTTGGAT